MRGRQEAATDARRADELRRDRAEGRLWDRRLDGLNERRGQYERMLRAGDRTMRLIDILILAYGLDASAANVIARSRDAGHPLAELETMEEDLVARLSNAGSTALSALAGLDGKAALIAVDADVLARWRLFSRTIGIALEVIPTIEEPDQVPGLRHEVTYSLASELSRFEQACRRDLRLEMPLGRSGAT